MTRAVVLSLYRRILRSHRSMPPEMRELGDKYVIAEFKKHKTAQAQFVPAFISEWTRYIEFVEAQMVSSAGASPTGRELTSHELGTLSDEQKVQLNVLRHEAQNPTI